MATKKIDPELQKQIQTAAADDAAVEAVVMLRPEKASDITVSPERIEAVTKKVLERVEQSQGTAPRRVNVFRNLGSFAIEAPRSFVRELLRQPEVASAMANRQPGSGLVPPPRNPRPAVMVKAKRSTASRARPKPRSSRSRPKSPK